jgi:hypothetical protein
MRVTLALALALALCVARTAASQAKTAPLDLSAAGVPVVIQAPEGAKAQKFLSTTRVSTGPHFSLEITPDPIYPMEFGAAKDAAKLESKVAFTTDTADTLVWESTGPAGARSAHFYTVVKFGGRPHACFDTRGAAEPYAKADVDAMLAACRSVKAK